MRLAFSLGFLCLSSAAFAIPVGYADLGPSRLVKSGDYAQAAVTPMGLDGTSLDGQTISFEVDFSGGNFVRAFTVTTQLEIAMRLPLDGNVPIPPNNNGQLAGSGYFVDAAGNSIGTPTPLIAIFESAVFPFKATDVVILGSLSGNTQRPLDLYGFHFDFSLSLTGATIEETGPYASSESVEVFANGGKPRNRVFGIGPNSPANFVPETGSSFQLAVIALGALAVCAGARNFTRSTS
jgi:hypothetical protein